MQAATTVCQPNHHHHPTALTLIMDWSSGQITDAASKALSSIDTSGFYTSSILAANDALNLGDAQFFEESISPGTVRAQLQGKDPSNPSTALELLKGMKWLLANMSKGRDVSDFFPHVVKLVGTSNLEVRKMVYIYLARYANHDDQCRELALLSINAFQRGLADREPLLRSLALRVLTCMEVPDVLQLQILGVRTCCKDTSPYVRKCAVNAVGKLHPRCMEIADDAQANQLVDIITNLLEDDGSTMVLTSAMIAFSEICPGRLDLLHVCFRKTCHLLTDMDEWGQVVVLDLLMKYCRTYFKQPNGQVSGSAEMIDQERRVIRGAAKVRCENGRATSEASDTLIASMNGFQSPAATPRQKPKVKRRVVRKAFYSDDEDSSSTEEVDPMFPPSGNIAGALREQPLLGSPQAGPGFRDDVNEKTSNEAFGILRNNDIDLDDEDGDLDEDHKLLLQSSLPLLRSRNSAVVLATCSLHYHCGIASIKIRSALGKALVRIHRDRREIQYIVLVSIRTLVRECPSAFTPFLRDFFIKGMDPTFTRLIKLDILVSLCLDPEAIDSVLTELRTYVRHTDTTFACAAVEAVGRIAELASVVYDRRSQTSDLDVSSATTESNTIALTCLFGLVTLSEYSSTKEVTGKCAETMQRILSQLWASEAPIVDPSSVQEQAVKRMLLLVARALRDESDDVDEEEWASYQVSLHMRTVRIPDVALAHALWTLSEWFIQSCGGTSVTSNLRGKRKDRVRNEILRMVSKSFTSVHTQVKLQAIHMASKILLMHGSGPASSSAAAECSAAEFILSLARIDVVQDVRDRGRFESNLLHQAVGLSHVDSSILPSPADGANHITRESARQILLNGTKPAPSSMPLGTQGGASHIFGMLTSVMSPRTASSSLPLWAETNSPSALRDPPISRDDTNKDLYSSQSSSSSSSPSSDSSESSSLISDSSNSLDSDSEDVDTQSLVGNGEPTKTTEIHTKQVNSLMDESSSSDSSSDESSSSDSDGSDGEAEDEDASVCAPELAPTADLISGIDSPSLGVLDRRASSSSVVAGLEDLVMSPLVTDGLSQEERANSESCSWKVFVKPELSSGLLVKMRVIRGKSRTREVDLMHLSAKSPGTLCLQAHVENTRQDGGSIRHVRLVHRGGSTAKVVTPPEIPVMKKGTTSRLFVGIAFESISDRDGGVVAKFDVKSDRGSTSIEIRPTIGEILNYDATDNMTQLEFDQACSKFHGLQRISTSLSLPCANENDFHTISHRILENLNMKQIGACNGRGSFVGVLPSSGQDVYVTVKCDRNSGLGDIIVCSSDAVAANGVASLVKKSLS